MIQLASRKVRKNLLQASDEMKIIFIIIFSTSYHFHHLYPLNPLNPLNPRTPMQSTVFESEEGEETVLKQEYVHNAHIMIGMILRAKPKKIVARRKSFVDSKFLNVHYSIGFCVFECALFCPKKIRYCCYCYFWYFAVITVITNVTVGTVIIVIVFLCYILILFLRFFLTFIF